MVLDIVEAGLGVWGGGGRDWLVLGGGVGGETRTPWRLTIAIVEADVCDVGVGGCCFEG